jgi:hypothetical protein
MITGRRSDTIKGCCQLFHRVERCYFEVFFLLIRDQKREAEGFENGIYRVTAFS